MMQALYSEQDLQTLRRQIGRRLAVFLLIFLGGLALAGVTLAADDHRQNRPELWTSLSVIFTGAAMIFFYDFMIHPLRAYEKFLNTSLHGRSHEVTAVYDHTCAEKSVVDGVTYQEMIFLGDADKHGDRERLFYWDAELPLPSFSKGEEITLRYFDRFITGYQR